MRRWLKIGIFQQIRKFDEINQKFLKFRIGGKIWGQWELFPKNSKISRFSEIIS